MTEALFRNDAYLTKAEAKIIGVNDRGGLIVDRTVFYPTGGGQPGDSGHVVVDGQTLRIVTAVKGNGDEIVLVPETPAEPTPGTPVIQTIDWDRRYRHMRVHTALHLLSVVIPLPVTGGQISVEKGRLDFDMPTAPEDKQAIEDSLNALVEQDLDVSETWIRDEELLANPALVKTMSVKPPMGHGRVRLVRITKGEREIDLQPCGGTHVRSTREIGQLRLGKVEKKSRLNRRVNVHLAEIPAAG
ncbi:MAG: alanyl-tRNA editing protein [Paracoccaceae bacterium]|nr:alanyl-tRNA editing protein [Paracoccaceae bacterium]MDE2911471.1 alanyl-tRNA editing protein [Paracoccaceae bacterium]